MEAEIWKSQNLFQRLCTGVFTGNQGVQNLPEILQSLEINDIFHLRKKFKTAAKNQLRVSFSEVLESST